MVCEVPLRNAQQIFTRRKRRSEWDGEGLFCTMFTFRLCHQSHRGRGRGRRKPVQKRVLCVIPHSLAAPRYIQRLPVALLRHRDVEKQELTGTWCLFVFPNGLDWGGGSGLRCVAETGSVCVWACTCVINELRSNGMDMEATPLLHLFNNASADILGSREIKDQ